MGEAGTQAGGDCVEGMGRGRDRWGRAAQAEGGDRVEKELSGPGCSRVHVVFKRQYNRIGGGLEGTFCDRLNCFLKERGL